MKNHSTRKINLVAGLVASLFTFSCQAEIAQAAVSNPKALNYESSLSEFKSINNDKDKLSANDAAQDMKGMDHSKMSPEEMKNMEGMDHSKMGGEEMKNMDHSKMGADEMKGMDHSKMTPDEMKNMKAAPKKSAKPSKVKKLKPMPPKPMPANETKPTAPAEASPHQNHQM